MVDEDRYVETLGNALNLTRYEASIYVALLKHGDWMTAGRASFLSRVPRPKTYGALRRLVEVQLVEQAPTNPTLYRGANPKKMLTPIMEEMKETLRILNDLAINHSQRDGDGTPDVWTFKTDEARKRLPAMIRSARAQIDILATPKGVTDIYNAHCNDLEKALKKRVEVKIFIQSKANRLIQNELKHIFQVKKTMFDLDVDCYLFDNRRLFIITKDEGLLVADNLLVGLLKKIFSEP